MSELKLVSMLANIIIFITGLVIGSFLNVVIYRLPLIINNQAPISLSLPRSYCPGCLAEIPWYLNIPIIGFIITKAKCINCNSKISYQYVVVEVITAILFVTTNVALKANLYILCIYLIFISFIICIVVIDYKTFLIPDQLSLKLLWLGLIFNLKGMIAGSLFNAVLGAVLGYSFLWLVFILFKAITKKDGMGYGDFKFLAAILAWLGYQYFIAILLIASTTAVIYYFIGRIWSTIETNAIIAFGPFLGIAAIIVLYSKSYLCILLV